MIDLNLPRLCVAIGLAILLAGCASVGIGIGFPIIPGVSIGVGVGSGGVNACVSA